MCINKEVSITTFLTSTFVVIYLWFRNYKYDKWYALFLLTFASIQFWEFLLWIYKGTKYDFLISGIIIPITLCLELLVPFFGKLWYENNYNWNIGEKLLNELKTSFFPYILLTFIIIFAILYSKYINKKAFTSLTAKGSLNWNNAFETTKLTYIFGFMFALLIAYPFKESSIYIPIFIFLSSIIVLVITDSFSSFWCLISNFASFLFLMYPYLDNSIVSKNNGKKL
jgi:hypothetical protein